MPDSVLVGDIGGTNVRFACVQRQTGGVFHLDNVRIMPGDAFASFDDALKHYFDEMKGACPKHALLALAGPIRNGEVALTNRDWVINGARLIRDLAFEQVRLVNDYAAMARAVPELSADHFQRIHDGCEPDGLQPILVAGPGTGFGMATLLPGKNGGWTVLTGEGGHGSYAASTEREWALKKRLQQQYGYVSKELILSGSGLNAVHRALCEIDGIVWQETPPHEIIARAKAGDSLCGDICSIRANSTLDALGDAALLNGTQGGAVISGGVAENLSDWLVKPEALTRFFERGSMRAYMDRMSIRLLKQGHTAALIGAGALYFDSDVAE